MDVLQRSPIICRPSLDDNSDVSWMAHDGKPQPVTNVTNVSTEFGSPSSPVWQAGRSEYAPPPQVAMQTPAWVSPVFEGLTQAIAKAIVAAVGGEPKPARHIEPGVRTFRSSFIGG